MKKGLLTAAAALCVAANTFAAGPLQNPANNVNYWKVDGYPVQDCENSYSKWEAVQEKYMVSFATAIDSAWSVAGIKGLTDFTVDGVADAWSEDGWSNRYPLTKAGNELAIEFNGAVGEWGNFQLNMSQWYGEKGAPTGESTNMGDYTLGGFFVNMLGNAYISGEVYIPSSVAKDGKFAIRASVIDAHGHEWNAGGDPIDTVTVFDDWTEFEISMEDLIADGQGNFTKTGGDLYGEKQWNMKRPMHDGNGNTGLAGEVAGEGGKYVAGTEASGDVEPIDFANIIGIRFYFQPGQVLEGTKGTVKMRKLQMANGSHAFTPGVKPDYSDVKEVAESTVEYTQEGATFSFEGTGVLTTVNGAVVAKGANEVVAPAAGLYFLTVDGQSAKVIVK